MYILKSQRQLEFWQALSASWRVGVHFPLRSRWSPQASADSDLCNQRLELQSNNVYPGRVQSVSAGVDGGVP